MNVHFVRSPRRVTTAALLMGAFLALTSATAPARGGMIISEFMYSGNGGEFVEFTNVGNVAIDMTGWSFDDDSRIPGVLDLSAFGIVAPGESVLITEDPAEVFRTDWGLSASVKIIGGYTNNLGRNDEINLYDADNNLVDRLAYGDTAFPGTIRTQRISGNPGSLDAEGTNTVSLWVLSEQGDRQNSFLSGKDDLGNPGSYVPFSRPTAIPEPSTALLAGLASLFGLAFRSRLRRVAR